MVIIIDIRMNFIIHLIINTTFLNYHFDLHINNKNFSEYNLF